MKMNRNSLVAGADFKFGAVVFQKQAKLFEVIGLVEIRARERGFKTAGAGYKAVT